MATAYPLEQRSMDVLKLILYANGPIRVTEITERLNTSRRSAYYDLDKIDDWLSANGLPMLIRDRTKGISVDSRQVHAIQQLLSEDRENPLRIFTPVERERLIICVTILSSRPVFTEDYMEWCVVSRNTTVADLKNVSAFLKKNKLSLYYAGKEGYRVQGDPIRSRALFCLYYPQFLSYFRDAVFSKEQQAILDDYHLRLKRIEAELKTEYVSGILPALAALVASMVNGRRGESHRRLSSERFSFSAADSERITATREYGLACDAFPELEQDECVYLTLHLLGSRLQTEPILPREAHGKAAELAEKLAFSFEEITGIRCTDRKELLSALTAHMETSLYRYRFGIQVGNPMLDHIRQQYKELFELTKAAFLRISDASGFHVSDAEIAYLALHFGACMAAEPAVQRSLRIMVICPNGVGVSNMIRQEVLRLMPQATDVQVCPLSQYTPDCPFDVILSTVPIPNEKRLIPVSPILTDLDKISILRKCLQTGPAARSQASDILEIAKKYVPEQAFSAFSQDIHRYFSQLGDSQLPKQNYGSGLLHYLTDSHIQFISEAVSWEDALRISCRPLLLEDAITEHYVDAIVAAQRDRKQYMLLTDGLVLAHAQVSDGAKKIDAAITICREPVLLGNGKPVQVIIALSAEDKTGHIQILNDVLTLFSSGKQAISRFCALTTKSEVTAYIRSRLEQEA